MGRKVYKLFSDMTAKERASVEEVVNIQRRINRLEEEVEKLRSKKSGFADKVLWYLKKTKYDGIEKDNTILYVSMVGGGTPSFWQVLMSIRNKLVHKDVVLLESEYAKQINSREKHEVLIVKTGG